MKREELRNLIEEHMVLSKRIELLQEDLEKARIAIRRSESFFMVPL